MTLTVEQKTMYDILLWVLPLMVTILGFVGVLGVKALISMNKTLNKIVTQIAVVIQKHDDLERRVEDIEDKI